MGVPGTVGLLKRYHDQWGTRLELKNMPVVIDTTGALYWFVKKNLLHGHLPMDRYGSSMVQLGQFYRELFRRLRERNCRPIVVHEGARKSEAKWGEVVSKHKFLERSSRSALRRLAANDFNHLTQLPSLTLNCLKEIVIECGLGADQVHQASHEVYPVLVQLARQHNCPVLTSHSDFILMDVPAGFVWLERLQVPADSQTPFTCTQLHHSKLLDTFKLQPTHSDALKCLTILMRQDFSQEHYNAVNNVLQLRGALALTRVGNQGRNNGRIVGDRLRHVLEHWPRDRFVSSEAVRAALASQTHSIMQLLRDYDALFDCYCNSSQPNDFLASELAKSFAGSQDVAGNQLQEALQQREVTCDFVANLTLTNFNRTPIEDVRTYRSSFSIKDRAKQYLLQRVRSQPRLRLFDRRRDLMEFRNLAPIGELQSRLDCDILFKLFHFDSNRRDQVSQRLAKLWNLDKENSELLALVLLLARFGYRLALRDTYGNSESGRGVDPARERRSLTPMESSGSLGRASVSLTSDQASQRLVAQSYSSSEVKLKFFTAVANSFVYQAARLHQGDQSRQEIPADIRLARDKIDGILKESPGVQANSSDKYFTLKHLVEVLNEALNGYKELNSLYNYPGPNILVNKYYDATLVFRIMARYSQTLAGYLLRLDDGLLAELGDL